MNRTALFFLLIALLLLSAGCGREEDSSSASSTRSAGAGDAKDDIAPLDDAYHRPGPLGDGRFVLPNGRMVKPAGDYIDTPTFPIDVAVSPDGATAVFATTYIARDFKPSVNIYDIALGQVTQVLSHDEGVRYTFAGIAFNAAGDRFYVAGGGDHSILEFSLVGGHAERLQRIPVQGFPCNIKLSADEQYLYAVLHMSKRMVKIRISDGKEMKSYPVHLFPYDVAIADDESMAWVSNQGADTVSAIDLNSTEEVETIDVGENPEGMALSPDGDTLYVANSDTDSISVIDTSTNELTDTWNLHNEDDVFAYGAFPVDIEVTPDGSRLLVTCAGYDSVDVIDTATGAIAGRIPTGWYPQNATYDPVGDQLFIVSGKGVGSHGTIRGVNWSGLLQSVDWPSDPELADYTDDTEEGIRWASNFYSEWTEAKGESPIPTTWGVRSDQIRHVVFILKENKTYDQVLGDLEGAEGDPSYNQFGEAITPNQHTLARRFVNCDNFYVEGDTSVVGHLWASYASVNDHMEKAFFGGGLYPLPDVEPGSQPAGGPYFAKVLDHGLEFRSYGQVVGLSQNLDRYAPYMNLHYGFWNMGTSDENEKAEEIIREWEKGLFPDFVYILLPNDHNYGGDAGTPTPRYLVADNDAGLGKLIDWLSHSEYWDETAVFVTEDDPQSGADHIDPHRTIGLVISPWAKKGHTSSVLYSMSSIWLTIDLILGLPPSSKFDQFAAPMYDAFTMEKDSTPYNYIPNPIPFELNGEDKFTDLFCGNPNFLVPDGAPGLSRVLWAMYKPGVPFPQGDSVDVCGQEDEEEEEAEEIAEYVEAVNRAVAYGKARGITVPVPEGWWELSAKIEADKARAQ